MELANYEITYRTSPTGSWATYYVYCHGEFEAINELKKINPNAVIISVKKQ